MAGNDLQGGDGVLGHPAEPLKGVNDDVGTMRRLVPKLLAIRLKPHYIRQIGLTGGAQHFRTLVRCGPRSSGLCEAMLRNRRGKIYHCPMHSSAGGDWRGLPS